MITDTRSVDSASLEGVRGVPTAHASSRVHTPYRTAGPRRPADQVLYTPDYSGRTGYRARAPWRQRVEFNAFARYISKNVYRCMYVRRGAGRRRDPRWHAGGAYTRRSTVRYQQGSRR
jgi:hypothetical protein